MAHRRAVDRVRSAAAASEREHKAALLDRTSAFDEVAEQVENRLEREQVRRCMRALTEAQRETVTLVLLPGTDVPGGGRTARAPAGHGQDPYTRRLIRLRDCLGVTLP